MTTDHVTIERRFCGPPESGNGGYSCGLLAAHVGGPAEVTLRRSPPRGIGAFGDAPADGPPFLLGRLAVRQFRPIAPASAQVVVGWRIAKEGRKLFAGSARFSDEGNLSAVAKATWIQLN